MKTFAFLLLLCTFGCAAIPDVTFRYYPARWSASATLVQTVGCNASKTEILVMNAASVSTSYSSNLNAEPFTFRVKDIDRFFADADFSVNLTEDGRLRGINQSTTGQGEGIVKAVIGLDAAVRTTRILRLQESDSMARPLELCDVLDGWGDKKPVAIISRASINESTLGKSVDFTPSQETLALHDALKSRLPVFQVHVEAKDKAKRLNSHPLTTEEESSVKVKVQHVESLGVEIKTEKAEKPLLSTRILTPVADTYTLPVPKAALFGKQSFSLALSEAGAVTSAGYGKTTGNAAALNSLTSIAASNSLASEAAEVKAEADLILQQQRLFVCTITPAQCK